MKKVFAIALGILAAIGGFVDIGDIVFNVEAGATFGYQLLWAVVIGVGGIGVLERLGIGAPRSAARIRAKDVIDWSAVVRVDRRGVVVRDGTEIQGSG